MILIDYREENETKKKANLDLIKHIREQRVPVQVANLEYGDAAFEMNGPDGSLLVGIERKSVSDMLACIDDGRLSGHQLLGMRQMYGIRVLMIEGHWKPHEPQGFLMEGYQNGFSWGFNKYRSQKTMYAKLYRFIISLQLSGVIVTYSRDPFHTAYNICEWFHYGQKKWDEHTSLKELHRIAMPTLNRKPTLVRLWAHAIEGVGTKISELVERRFKTPIELATADEVAWLSIPGVGVKLARDIVAKIQGWKR